MSTQDFMSQLKQETAQGNLSSKTMKMIDEKIEKHKCDVISQIKNDVLEKAKNGFVTNNGSRKIISGSYIFKYDEDDVTQFHRDMGPFFNQDACSQIKNANLISYVKNKIGLFNVQLRSVFNLFGSRDTELLLLGNAKPSRTFWQGVFGKPKTCKENLRLNDEMIQYIRALSEAASKEKIIFKFVEIGYFVDAYASWGKSWCSGSSKLNMQNIDKEFSNNIEYGKDKDVRDEVAYIYSIEIEYEVVIE